MSEFVAKWGNMRTISGDMIGINKSLQQLNRRFESAKSGINSINSFGKYGNVSRTLGSISDALYYNERIISKLADVLVEAANEYQSTEQAMGVIRSQKVSETTFEVGAEEKPFDWKVDDLVWKVLGKAGTVGSIVSAFGSMATNGISYKTLLGGAGKLVTAGGSLAETIWKKKTERNWSEFLFGKWKTGSAISGLADTTTKWKTFKSSLSKKWKSYFPDSITNVGEKIKIAAEWAGVAISAVTNGISNYDEFGTMKNLRFWEETIMETIVDVGVGALATAGATAVLGASAPAIAVGVAGAGVVWLADLGVRAVTKNFCKEEKGLTETISDTVLDIGEAVVGGAKNLFANIGNAVKSGGRIGVAWGF